MAGYFDGLGASIKDLARNPVLLVPFILQAIGILLLFVLLLLIGGAIILGRMGITLQSLTTPESTLAAFAAVSWTPGLIATIAVVAAAALLIIVLVNAWFTAGELAMVNDVVEGRRTGGGTFFAGASGLTGRFFLFHVLQALLLLAAALPLLLFILLALKSQGVAFVLLAVLFGLLFLAAALSISVALFFGPPILVRERPFAWGAIRRSASLLREKPGHVILSFLTALVFSMVVSIAIGLIAAPFQALADTHKGSLSLQLLNFAFTILRNLVYLLISIVAALFTFRMYVEGWPAPQRKAKK